MYVRKVKSKSGKVYVQVIDKSSKKYKVIKSIGSSTNEREIQNLITKGKKWIDDHLGIREIDFSNSKIQIEQFFHP